MIAMLLFVLAQAPPKDPPKVETSPAPKVTTNTAPKVTGVRSYVETKPVTPTPKDTDAKPADGLTIDAIIAASVKHDPDVKIAEAEVQLALAKLNAVKLTAAQKVTAKQQAIMELTLRVKAETSREREIRMMLEERTQEQAWLVKAGASAAEVSAAKQKINEIKERISEANLSINQLQSQLSLQVQFWKRLTDAAQQDQSSTQWAPSLFTPAVGGTLTGSLLAPGGSTGSAAAGTLTLTAPSMVREGTPLTMQQVLRAALDLPVKLDQDLEDNVVVVTMGLLAKAKMDIRVKYPDYVNPKLYRQPAKIKLEKGEMSLGAWLALVTDEYTDAAKTYLPEYKELEKARMDFYVRDYGLQLTTKTAAAPGAMPLTEFWKQPLMTSPAKTTAPPVPTAPLPALSPPAKP